ncbi:MAG: hypothetical protein FWC16_10195 [Defluviitaleaceae bacterium]|nr:hypothetical protein [Defluviitaleaceae bacterium]MCL2275286.1 hypothetical protein [Defluviitaleaceae bacterium]
MIILDAAYKHGLSYDEIKTAYENAISILTLEEYPPKFMAFGFDSKGRALEIGYIENINGDIIIIHAMKIRKQYLKYI